MNDQATPPWPGAAACPPWCTRQHDPADHPEDQRHQGAAQLVTLEISPAGAADWAAARLTEMVVHADRPARSADDWLRIESTESPDVRLTLTAPAARKLMRALGRVLDEISQ